MGLGKTLQALAIACVYRSEWPLLVICPSTLRFQWVEEIEKWCRPFEKEGAVKAVLTGKDNITGTEAALFVRSSG
jgi:SWI/SNF-related matrix-associated actin-dependent regulator 1 of chromatin subfamily A